MKWVRLTRSQAHRTRDAAPDTCGFTLVELLVTISIITLLASMVLVALAGVQETARSDRTRAQIARIGTLINEKWETYRNRRMPLPPAARQAAHAAMVTNAATASAATVNKLSLDASRVNMVREMMRMEMPDRKTDLLMGPVVMPPSSVPTIWYAYRRQAARLITQRRPDVKFPLVDKVIDKQLDVYWSSDFESAECLYLILTQMVDQDSKAMDFFPAQEIGDVDGDGMPEILDGWRRPIIFLRWAPGLQIVGSPQDGKSPDPFDLLSVFPHYHQVKTFALYPLVASAGPDRQMEIFADNPDERSRINYALTQPPNNPFLGIPGVSVYQDQTTVMVGTPQDSNGDGILGWIDNITNHNLTGS